MHRVPWRRQTDQRHWVEFLKNLEKGQNQSRRRFFLSETNQGTGPIMEEKRKRKMQPRNWPSGTKENKKKNEKETNQGTGPMKLDSSGDCIWSDVHPLQLLNHHHAVLGRVFQHQLQKYIFCLSSYKT